MKSKRTYCSIVFLLLCLHSIVAGVKTDVTVWTKDGNGVSYGIEDHPKFTFTMSELVVTYNSVEITYLLDDIDRVTYDEESESGIGKQIIKTDVKYSNDAIVFQSLIPNSTITVFTANGIPVLKKTMQEPGEYCISLSSLKPNVYLVSINGFTSKVVVR